MSSSPASLQGKVALVTGATRGIGLATARALGAQGARLVISSRKQPACEQVCTQLHEQGIEAIAVAAHVGVDADRVQLLERSLAHYGRLDVLVANAAVNPSFDLLAELKLEVWNKILETNLTAPMRLAQLAAPHLAQCGGTIVMVSSITGELAVPRSGAYAVSKAAENHLARQLAAEWGPQGVRVNVVAPGTTRTDMIRSLMASPGAEQAAINSTALRRLAEPEDIAAVILFLASPASRHMTGQVLTVDGGQSLGLAAA